MDRIPEPELMDGRAQALAYASADFEQPHARVIQLVQARFAKERFSGRVLDLGCGPADITLRFARAYPDAMIEGVDGAEAMLAHGRNAVAAAGLGGRIRLTRGCLPHATLNDAPYDAAISNSLLHHLHHPMVMWDCLKRWLRPGAPVFVMDLRRPDSPQAAAALVAEYAANEPDVLRHDFHHSLLAAFRPDEVRGQLSAAGLDTLEVDVVSDRHLTVSGYMP